MTVFFQLEDVPPDEKAATLKQAAQGGNRRVDIEPSVLTKLPGCPFSYWVPPVVRGSFQRFKPLHQGTRRACAGAVTNDNTRFVRLSWEGSGSGYACFVKGGKFSPYYADVELQINWKNDGKELKSFVSAFRESHGWSPHWAAELHNAQYYFRPGLTWPLRTQKGLGMRALPAGCVFGHKGPALLVENDDPEALLPLLALTTSSSFCYLVDLQMAFGSYEVGVIQRTPVPELSKADQRTMASYAREAWSLTRTLDSVNETSHAFTLPKALRVRLGLFDPQTMATKLARIQRAIHDLAFRAYEFEGEDRAAIESWAAKSKKSADAREEPTEDSDEADEADSADATATLYSWAIGVAFGRFDIRLATGERQAPPEPEPFDPLPARSPGMIPESDEAQFPARPLLVDDPGHPLDLAVQAGDVLERVGFALESPESLRRWLACDFFPLHIKMYSKSRRKAPIYWQLATPSASYSVWLYIHAFSRDALYQVQEIVELKLRHEERKLESLRAESGASPTAAQRKVLESQESFVEELRAFLEEVKRVAPFWNPNLDDGVIINFAPLWRLVPHHKPWQKELKATWDALCAEEYEWAHLAMHLWPERVVPKCATDRSLAIAHGLEDVFWLEGEDGKWKPRPIPARPMEELVSERTSPAVKAALEDLLTAPVAPSGGGRGRPRRGRRAGGATV